MGKLVLFLFLLASLLCQGCRDEEPLGPERPDIPLSVPLSSVMEVDIDEDHLNAAWELDKNEVVCHFMLVEGEYAGLEFDIKARVVRLRGKSQLRMDAALPVGKQRILYINYRGDTDPSNAPLRSFGLGYLLTVTEDDVAVEGHFDETAGLVGQGTETDPYLINCDNDLLILQGLVNKDETGGLYKGKYFRQTCDIDMTYVCDFLNVDYGWLPIGYTNTKPFRGFYNGGGYTVSNLRLDRPKTIIGGLFGCLYGAKVDSLTILDADIQVEAIAGAIAGTVIVAGSDNQAGGTAVSSQVSHCTVRNSRIKSSAVAGGLVGMADVYSRLLVDNCEIPENNTLVSDYGPGGVVGIGVFKSFVVLQNVNNALSVRTTMGAAGGLIGTSDTLLVVNSQNLGAVTVNKDGEERFGAGGIAGGTGCGQFVNCINKGNVAGDRGVGGILGSALVDKGKGTEEDPGLYNSALFMTCVNQAAIQANSYGGGICGEAQVTAISCGNFGQVKVAGGYAAGVVGNSPAIALFDCMNKGAVSADRMSGGLNGLAIFGTAAFCNNYGDVSSAKGYSGGIMGLGGGGAMIHYCGNYGDIDVSNSDGPCGGIVGELGKIRKWEASDIVSVIMGSVGIITSVASMATSSTFYSRERKIGQIGNLTDLIEKINLNKQIRVSDITFLALNLSQGIVNTVLADFDIFARILPSSPWVEVEKTSMQKAIEGRSFAIRDSLDMVRKAMSFDYSMIPLVDAKQTWTDQTTSFEKERKSVIDNDVKLRKLNDELDLRRANLQEKAESDKARRDQAFDILNAVLAAVSLIVFIASIPVTGGAAGLALGIVSSAVGMISGASTIGKSVMNYQVNATEVSQCYNYGQVSGGSNSGGIVGVLNDYGHMYDCYNAGAVSRAPNVGLVAGKAGNQIVLANTLDMSSGSYISSMVGQIAENPNRIEHNYQAIEGYLPQMAEESFYTGWDFKTNWLAPVFQPAGNTYRLPIINQSSYAKK